MAQEESVKDESLKEPGCNLQIIVLMRKAIEDL
jgi:hypothetical protein